MTQLKRVQTWGWLLFLLGGGLVLLWDGAAGSIRPSPLPTLTHPIIADDINQHRLNAIPPVPRGDWIVTQTFVPRHDGLQAVELILTRNGEPQPDENGRFTITLLTENGELIAEQTLESRTIAHNHTFLLQFPPQPDSAGRSYQLQLSGNADNPLSAWGYDLDVHDEGALTLTSAAGTAVPDTAVADLRFITKYQLSWAAALSTIAGMVWRDGVIILLTLFFLPLPGLFLMRLRPLPRHNWDAMAWFGTALALGIVCWPLIWYLFSLAGGRWSTWSLWLLIISGWIVYITLNLTRRHSLTPSPLRRHHLWLLLLLIASLAVRLLAVRDLNTPPWVDASRHALITAVMVENGRTLTDYAPYLPEVTRFPYHFGFHTLSATLGLMTGWDLPRLLLILGQLLNALLPLTVYTAVWLMTRRARAALLAAFLVAIPFFFPAYYATWGRLTQLTAMLIMPLLVAFTWLLIRGAKTWRQAWWLVALFAAGLFLIHFRVFLFYVPFALLVWLVSWGRHGRWLALSALTALIIISPRLYYLNAITEPARALSYNIPNYNQFPTNYYQAGWDRYFIWLAGTLMILVLLAFIRRRAWSFLPLTLALWVWLLLMMLAGDYLGLPSTSLVNLNSLYITLFLPLAIFLGVLLDRLWRWLKGTHWILLSLGYVLAGGLLTAVFLFGVQQQISILNPQTILVQPQDIPALYWLDENLPPEAALAASSWKWLGQTWAGADGGAWLVPLTRRTSSIPPADYTYDRSLFEEINAFNEAATAVTDWSDAATAVWLQEQGVTHLFVGARGGFLDPAALAKNPYLQLIYSKEGVFIFEIDVGSNE